MYLYQKMSDCNLPFFSQKDLRNRYNVLLLTPVFCAIWVFDIPFSISPLMVSCIPSNLCDLFLLLVASLLTYVICFCCL